MHLCWAKIELSSIIQHTILSTNPAKMERIKLWLDQTIRGGLGFQFNLEAVRKQQEWNNDEKVHNFLKHTWIPSFLFIAVASFSEMEFGK